MDDVEVLKARVSEANDWLKAEGLSVRLKLKGQNIALVATLPKKAKHGIGTKQYDISLGIPATKTGIARAKREAVKLADRVVDGSFRWEMYEKPESSEQKSIGEWLKAFEAHYMKTHKIAPKTWKNTWQSTFNKLPKDDSLRESLLLAVVESTEPDSRNRELTCQRLQKLAEFAGMKIDLSPYSGDYEPEPRDIPPDELILEWYDRIPNPHWQWVFGMMATFGLRPHECFNCRFMDPLTVKVDKNTKTGERLTKAIPPEWVDLFSLTKGSPPPGKNGTNANESRTNKQFKRYKTPFVPYDLRHAYAIRVSVVRGVPHSTAAKWMGHKVATHQKVYHRWLTDATNEQVYQSIILGKTNPPLS